jgi:hypothetical protein
LPGRCPEARLNPVKTREQTMSAPVIRIYQAAFHAESARTGPLSWAQQAMRDCIEWLGEDSHFYNIPALLPVPRGVSAADVAREAAVLTEHHEALRTKFGDEDGEPVQRVSCTGSVTLRVFDFDVDSTGPEQDGSGPRHDRMIEDHADSVVAALRSLPFDAAAEWPVRFVLIAAHGTPHYLALIAFHLAVDGAGLEICKRQLREAMNRIGAASGPEAGIGAARVVRSHGAPAWHPIDQAWLERGPYGARVNERAAAYWRAELHKVPVPLFSRYGPPTAGRRAEGIGLVSYATAAASLALARKSGTTTATIMLAATAALLGRFTGHNRVALGLLVGNRFRRQTKDSVALLVQDTLIGLDVGDRPFADIVAAAASSSLVAYSAGHYDPALIRRLRAEAAGERDVAAIETSVFFDDLGFPGWQDSVPAGLSQAEVAGLRADSLPVQISSLPRQDPALFVHCRYVPRACLLAAFTDTATLPLAAARAFLRAMEELAVRAAFEEVSADCITEIAALAREQEGKIGMLTGAPSASANG